jgi:hypothetical protein
MFDSHRLTDKETKDCITRYYHNHFTPQAEELVSILDPHTAVGVVVAETLLENNPRSLKGNYYQWSIFNVCIQYIIIPESSSSELLPDSKELSSVRCGICFLITPITFAQTCLNSFSKQFSILLQFPYNLP